MREKKGGKQKRLNKHIWRDTSRNRHKWGDIGLAGHAMDVVVAVMLMEYR
jgi:hypothetical protein